MSSLFSLVSLILVISAVVFVAVRTIPPPEQGGGVGTPDAGLLAPIDAAENAKQLIESREGTAVSTSLDLSGQGLTAVPSYVFARTSLTTLDLSHNTLSGALPGEVRHLAKLTTLDLSYNGFTGVPAEVGQLENLEVLNLSHNKLTGLPYELGNLKNLKTLDLRGNKYAEADLAIIKEKLPPTTVILVE